MSRRGGGVRCVLVVCGAMMCSARPGCGLGDGSRERVVVTIDWGSGTGDVPVGITGSISEGEVLSVRTLSGTIDGGKRAGMRRRLHDERTGVERSVEVYPYMVEGAEGKMHIYLRTDFACEIIMRNFEGGSLEDRVTGNRLVPPFVFEPGEYRLEAVKPKQGA